MRLYIFLILLTVTAVEMAGTVDTPSALTHCLKGNDSVSIPNPFPELPANDSDIQGIFWSRITKLHEDETKEYLLRYSPPNWTWTVVEERAEVFDVWGMKLNDVNVRDSGEYRLTVAFDENILMKDIRIVVTNPPELSSPKLTVETTVLSDGMLELSCGELQSEGMPDVDILWWHGTDGTIHNSTRQEGGFWYLKVAQTQDSSDFTCGLDPRSSAFRCIPGADLDRWSGVSVHQNTSVATAIPAGTTTEKTPAAGKTTGTITEKTPAGGNERNENNSAGKTTGLASLALIVTFWTGNKLDA